MVLGLCLLPCCPSFRARSGDAGAADGSNRRSGDPGAGHSLRLGAATSQSLAGIAEGARPRRSECLAQLPNQKLADVAGTSTDQCKSLPVV
jgi:hypothetical protein